MAPLAALLGLDGTDILAIATVALALAAFFSVRQARKSALATEEAVEVAREDQAARERPYIIASPNPTVGGTYVQFCERPDWKFAFRLWNLRPAPGIVERFALYGHVAYEPPILFMDRHIILAGDGRVDERREVDDWSPDPSQPNYQMEIVFTDLSGRRKYKTVQRGKLENVDGQWVIHEMTYETQELTGG